MGNPRDRDPMDAWLNADVEPLAPPPGTFERIRRRARRRKAGRAVVSAAGIVIVIAAAVAAPRIAPAILQSHKGPRPSVAVGRSSFPGTPTPGRGSARPNAASPTRMPPGTSSLPSRGTSTFPVPRNFQPTSVTFVSQSTGAVIGQAGTPGHCATAHCTSLAGTSDYGTNWYGVSAPLTGAPDGASGVSQLRFLNARDGWAFGPELWVTHNGGAQWTREQTFGLRVTGLETADGRAFAILASCSGTGPDYGAHCTSFSLYSSPAKSHQWKSVPVPAATLQGSPAAAGPPGSASLVLVGGSAGGTGYLLAPSGELLSGPLTGEGWSVANQAAPCAPGAPGAHGQPTGGLLAANSNLLVLVCTSAASAASDTQAKSVEQSTDGGAHWSRVGDGLPAGIATSVAIQAQDNLVVLATDSGLYRSGDGGRTWRQTQPSPPRATSGEPGFSYVGMTSPANGVALPADARLHEVFITTDGGISWQPHSVSAP